MERAERHRRVAQAPRSQTAGSKRPWQPAGSSGSAAAAPARAPPRRGAAGPRAGEAQGAEGPPRASSGDTEDLQVLTVRNFLESPVRRRFIVAVMDGDVARFRSQVGGASDIPADEVVLTVHNRLMMNGESVRDTGASAETEVIATRKVRGGSASAVVSGDVAKPGWTCHHCLACNRAGLGCFQCGMPHALPLNGDADETLVTEVDREMPVDDAVASSHTPCRRNGCGITGASGSGGQEG